MKSLAFFFLFTLFSIPFTFTQSDLEKTIIANYSVENNLLGSNPLDTLTATEAELRLYEEVTFRGTIKSIFIAYAAQGKPTFLNIDGLFPNNPVVLVIFESDRNQFLPAEAYQDQEVVIRGKVKLHKYEFGWKSSIVLKQADQIKILE